MTNRDEREQTVLELSASAGPHAATPGGAAHGLSGGSTQTPPTGSGERADDPLYPPMAPERVGGGRRTWARAGFALAAALVAAVLTYAISSAVAGTYRASTQLRVTVDGPAGLGQDSVLAGNQLTAQLVQVLPTDAVLSRPAAQLGLSTSKLRSTLSVGSVAQQNIIQISETGSSKAQAERRANAVTAGLIAFMARDARTQLSAYQRLVGGAITGLQAQLSRLARAGGKLTPVQAAVLQGEAGAIANQAGSLRGQLAQREATSVPIVQEIQPATTASKVSPRPLLYAIVALLVVAFVAVQLVSLAERRSYRY
ncbi:MAG TPA: hypothetical protein VE992_01605 [Solirubrobacteraceae bacterium]|nr:hypothetical protein [Solirubrobacteraceae bacterium]